jgi:hypothetical protein
MRLLRLTIISTAALTMSGCFEDFTDEIHATRRKTQALDAEYAEASSRLSRLRDNCREVREGTRQPSGAEVLRESTAQADIKTARALTADCTPKLDALKAAAAAYRAKFLTK